MSKSILIVDTPKSCGDCRFCDYIEPIKSSICTADPAKMFKMRDEGAIYSILDERCPLRPLPQKKVPYFDPNANTYDEEKERSIMNEIDGYNRCIDEIVGEIEG